MRTPNMVSIWILLAAIVASLCQAQQATDNDSSSSSGNDVVVVVVVVIASVVVCGVLVACFCCCSKKKADDVETLEDARAKAKAEENTTSTEHPDDDDRPFSDSPQPRAAPPPIAVVQVRSRQPSCYGGSGTRRISESPRRMSGPVSPEVRSPSSGSLSPSQRRRSSAGVSPEGSSLDNTGANQTTNIEIESEMTEVERKKRRLGLGPEDELDEARYTYTNYQLVRLSRDLRRQCAGKPCLTKQLGTKDRVLFYMKMHRMSAEFAEGGRNVDDWGVIVLPGGKMPPRTIDFQNTVNLSACDLKNPVSDTLQSQVIEELNDFGFRETEQGSKLTIKTTGVYSKGANELAVELFHSSASPSSRRGSVNVAALSPNVANLSPNASRRGSHAVSPHTANLTIPNGQGSRRTSNAVSPMTGSLLAPDHTALPIAPGRRASNKSPLANPLAPPHQASPGSRRSSQMHSPFAEGFKTRRSVSQDKPFSLE